MLFYCICSYMSSLVRSMSLVLDEFYSNLKAVGVSAVSGEGMDELFTAIDEASEEYERDYRKILQDRLEKKIEKEEKDKNEYMNKLKKDINNGNTNGGDGEDVDERKREEEEVKSVMNWIKEKEEEGRREKEEDKRKKEVDGKKDEEVLNNAIKSLSLKTEKEELL